MTALKEAEMVTSLEREKAASEAQMKARLAQAKDKLAKKIFEGASDINVIEEYERKRQALNMPDKARVGMGVTRLLSCPRGAALPPAKTSPRPSTSPPPPLFSAGPFWCLCREASKRQRPA